MLFSLSILCHNCEDHIDSLLNTIELLNVSEDYDYEIIFVVSKDNDDDTIDKLNRYSNINKRVTHIYIEDTGGLIGKCRNICAALCAGDYIWFLDSDDWITDSDALKYFYDYLKDKPVDILNFDFYWKGKSCKNNYSKGEVYCVVWSRIFSNKFLMNNKFSDTITRGEDCDFVKRNFGNTNDIGYIPKILYHYNYPRKNSLCYNIYTKEGAWKEGEVEFDKDAL